MQLKIAWLFLYSNMKQQKTLCVYILKCNDDSYYIGITNNINLRLSQHSEGISPTAYTFERRPGILVHEEYYTDFLKAIAREKQLKRWSRAKKEALISGNYEKLIALSKTHGSTSSP